MFFYKKKIAFTYVSICYSKCVSYVKPNSSLICIACTLTVFQCGKLCIQFLSCIYIIYLGIFLHVQNTNIHTYLGIFCLIMPKHVIC